jgi:hypothetical protein
MNKAIFGFLLPVVLLTAQNALTPGTYKGEWSGASGGGEIHITFHADSSGALTPEVGFTLGGEDVKCKVLSFKVDGAKFHVLYEFDAQGTMLQSALEATANGKTIEGTYKTTAGDQAVDTGTWKAVAP